MLQEKFPKIAEWARVPEGAWCWLRGEALYAPPFGVASNRQMMLFVDGVSVVLGGESLRAKAMTAITVDEVAESVPSE